MVVTIITFLIILGILVFVHEFGHFTAARKAGMKVDEFGFGFPPRLAGVQNIDGKLHWVWGTKNPIDPDKTVYSINLIPLGGFVKILGENNEGELDPRSFINRSFGGRLLTLVAGVFMNVVLAWVLISIGYIVGIPAAIDDPAQLPHYATLRDARVAIIEVVPGLPADKAGIKPGDFIENINGTAVVSSEQAHDYIQQHAGEVFNIRLKRGNEEKSIAVQSQKNPEAGQGPTGIALASLGKLTVPWYLSWYEGLKTTGIQIYNILNGFWTLISSHIGLSSLGGPVKIAQLTGEVTKLGFIYLIQFTAFLSLNLAVLNILPFPALDGGRVLFLIIEKLRGKRNNQKIEQAFNATGFALLLLLMLLVTLKDISAFTSIINIFHKIF